MADKPTIKENAERLKQIVLEKGFWGYKNRYREILEQVITKETTYEELSDENRAILCYAMGLTEDEIKTLSRFVYSSLLDDEEDKTRIGCVCDFLKYRSGETYNPISEDKRPNPLDEYIALLGVSLYMLKVYNGTMPSEAPVLFRKEIRKFVRQHYTDEKYDGLLSLFNGNVVIDLSMYDVAIRLETMLNNRMEISPIYDGYWQVKNYNAYRNLHIRFGSSCRNEDEFLRTYNYIYLNFPKKDIEAYLSSSKTYSILFAQLTDDMRNSLSVEQLESRKKKVLSLIKEANAINGDWSKTLLDHLNTLKKWLQKTNRKNSNHGLSDKMRLYLLKLISEKSLNGETLNSVAVYKLYAAVMGITEANVKTYFERLDGKDKNYNLLVRNMERVYNYIDALGDKTIDRQAMLNRIELDLIPGRTFEKTWREDLNKAEFVNEDLERIVRRATEDFYKNLKE